MMTIKHVLLCSTYSVWLFLHLYHIPYFFLRWLIWTSGAKWTCIYHFQKCCHISIWVSIICPLFHIANWSSIAKLYYQLLTFIICWEIRKLRHHLYKAKVQDYDILQENQNGYTYTAGYIESLDSLLIS